MSSKYPILPPDKIIKVMKQLGFYKISQKGSHAKYKNEASKTQIPFATFLPMHNEIAKGTLKSILEQADIELEEFLKHLKS